MDNLKLKHILNIILLFILSISQSLADNPFLPMTGKSYGEYAMAMKRIHYELDFMEQEQADSLLAYMDEAVKIANSNHWKLEAEILRITYNFRTKNRTAPDNTYTIENSIRDYKTIYNKAEKEGNDIIRLRALRALMNAYYVFIKDYDLTFATAKILEKELDLISSEELPEKLYAYCEIAGMHFKFRNYAEAESFFNKVIEDTEANHCSLLEPAFNGLGLIYRYYYDDFEISDMYFRRMLDVPKYEGTSAEHYLAWEGIAKGNIGMNLYLRKKYEEAIPLLEFAQKRLAQIKDFSFASSMVITLADISLKQNKLLETKEYIELATEYIKNTYPPQSHSKLYTILSKYYVAAGNNQLAMIYKDSAFIAQKEEYEEYNALKLLYAEQRNWNLEQKAKEDELNAEHMRAANYRKLAISIGIGTIIVIILLLLVFISYRKKNNAYRILVKKNKEWANSRVSEIKPITTDTNISNKPTQEELEFMKQIQIVIEKEKLYTNPDFDLTSLADKFNTNRTYLSAIINHCTGKSFTSFINDYRISEAIQIMSSPTKILPTMDEIAYRAGFNDRKSLYRVFKKITGLTPSEFRDNINKESTE